MIAKAQLSNVRMAPRKVRALRDVVVDQTAKEAQAQLLWNGDKAAKMVGKLLKSAVANAENNLELKEDNLKVANLIVNEGMKFKRYQPVSRGSAHPFVKRNSHVTIVLDEIKPTKAKRSKRKEADIETLTVEELTASEQKSEEVVEKKNVEDSGKGKGADLETYNKVKMQQQGGDKKKTHRRKSIG